MTGARMKDRHPSLLHGTVDEPIPIWSHIFEGDWYNLKLQSGFRVSEETMAKARALVAASGGPAPAATAEEKPKPIRIKKPAAAAGRETPAATSAPAPAPKPRAKKAATTPATTLTAEPPQPLVRLETNFPSRVEEVLRIPVRPIEIDGRSYVWNSTTAKVYTTKFKYVGRYDTRESKLDTSYPDSDAE